MATFVFLCDKKGLAVSFLYGPSYWLCIHHEYATNQNPISYVGYQLVDSNQNHIFELKVDEKEEELALPPL